MSVLPIEQIIRDGRGPTQPFSIRIVGCNLAPASVSQHQLSTFGVTFDGSTTNDDLFAVHGLGRGVGLQIANEEGDVATPGQKMPVSMLAESGVWNYTLRLIADRNPLRAGSYRATVQFKLDYY
ncbi:type 1 fimbrial protein [Enterobacter bugandensis]|nr:type 1 fimbrial protein [Enterobacter bugandensis]MCK6964558.1 type 1 fimbrial protein [Enterobacter bugandensis]